MILIIGRRLRLCGMLFLALLTARAQNLINVKPATGALTAPTGPAVVGTSGDIWNGLGNLPSTDGTLVNDTAIIFSGLPVSRACVLYYGNGHRQRTGAGHNYLDRQPIGMEKTAATVGKIF